VRDARSFPFPAPTGTTAVANNPDYAKLFGAGSLAVGIAVVVLISFLRKLITNKAEILPEELAKATVIPVA
jgi:proton-dependent oligopeptide transporter, POT family